MKIVIAQDSCEGLEQVGIYKNGKLAYQYDTFECEPPSIVEVLDRLLDSLLYNWVNDHSLFPDDSPFGVFLGTLYPLSARNLKI